MNYGSVREVGHLESSASMNFAVETNDSETTEKTNVWDMTSLTNTKIPFDWRILVVQSIRNCWFLVVEWNLTHFLPDDINHTDFSMEIPSADI